MEMKVMREITIWICEVCGEECGLPYYGRDDKGYGSCCDHKMRKAEKYLESINKIRKEFDIPELEITFELLAETSKRWEGTRYHLKRVK